MYTNSDVSQVVLQAKRQPSFVKEAFILGLLREEFSCYALGPLREMRTQVRRQFMCCLLKHYVLFS